MKWVSFKESCEHLPQTLPAMQHHSEMANLPRDVLEQFFPLSNYFPFQCVTAGLCSPVPLQIAPTRCLRLPSRMKDHAVTVWGSWRGCHQPGCLHGDRAEHLCCHRELWHSCIYQTVTYFSPSAIGCHILVSRSPVSHSTWSFSSEERAEEFCCD